MARAIPTGRRKRQVRDSTLWAALAALAIHGTILGTIHALGLSMLGEGFRPAAAAAMKPIADDVELASSCEGNAAFATSGRAALCLAPWVDDVDRCLADAQLSLWIDLSSCQSRNDPRTAIAIVEQKTADRLPQIDPERLLEDRPHDAPPPPPPPPPQQAQAAPPPPPPPAPPENRQQQVIETVKPKDEKEPDNARFLSEFNTSVDKQKVSRGARNEPMVAKAKPEELTAKDKPKEEPSVKHDEPERMPGINPHAPDVPGTLSMRNPGALRPSQAEQEAKLRGSTIGTAGEMTADGYIARKGDGAIAQDRRERSEIPRGDNGAGGGAPRAPDLKLSQDVLERVAGGGSVDRLDDVANSDETALSSRRWIYAGFFNRLKRQVAQNWDPSTVWRRRDPTGTVFGSKTRITEVRVSLSPQGALSKIVVVTPSGVSELDDEAVRAFRSAGPFPNPPDGLVQKDNLITFAFSFAFEIGAPRLSWHMPTAM